MTYLTSRSDIITYQVCPRKRFYSKEYKGRGIEKVGLSKDLFTGICVHRGLEAILRQVLDHWPISEKLVQTAVDLAINHYDQECQSNNFFGVQENEQSFLYLELRALIEALIRVYAKVQLPRLLEEFEVLEVEREYCYELVPSSYTCPTCKNRNWLEGQLVSLPSVQVPCPDRDNHYDDSITLMSRPDALLRERSTGHLYILSFKTAADYNNDPDIGTDAQNRYDMQGISEVVAVEAELQKQWEAKKANPHSVLGFEFTSETAPKISGIKMEYLIKGKFMKCDSDNGPTERGKKFTNNYLIHPFYSEAADDFSYFWKWTDDEGKNRQLGKGWKRINLWERSSTAIKEWIDILAQDQERNPLEKVIATPEIYFRHEAEISDWLEQTRYQEGEIQNAIAFCSNPTPLPEARMRLFLNQHFPQYRHSCFSYSSPCQFIDICWKGDSPEDETYKARTPNHQIEKDKFQC